MRSFLMVSLGLILTFGFASPVMSQQPAPQRVELIPGQKKGIRGAFIDSIYASLDLPSSDLAADDGHYLAQNKAELQTYYDLKLSYKYLGEEYLRRHLGIASNQGIIIAGAQESGQGFRNGLRGGDIVLTVDSEPVKTQYELVIALNQRRGEQRTVKVLREGKQTELNVTLSEQDEQANQSFVIGVSVDEITTVTKSQLKIKGGVAVSQISEGGSAHEGGLQVHDIITLVDGQPIGTLNDLRDLVSASKGKQIRVEIIRGGEEMSVNIVPKAVVPSKSLRLPSGQRSLEKSARTVLLGNELSNEGGTLMLLPRSVRSDDALSADARYALAWSTLGEVGDTSQSGQSLSGRITDIEATLAQLKEQIGELKSSRKH